MAVIEVDREWDAAAQPLRPPRSRRPVAVLACVALVLLLGPARAPVPPLVAEVSVNVADGSVFQVGGGTVYVAEPRPLDTARLIAYALPTGHIRWATTLPVPAGVLDLRSADGVVLVQAYRTATGPAQVVAVDVDTGHLLWRHGGEIIRVPAGGGRVLVEAPAEGLAAQVLQSRTGTVLWSRALWAGTAETVASPPAGYRDRVVLQPSGGGAQVLDAGTGRLLASAAVPAGLGLYAIHDLVLVPLRLAGNDMLAAYDLASLDLRWLVKLAGPATSVTDCGNLLCVTGVGVLSVLYTVDGGAAWPASPWATAEPAGRYLLATGPHPALLDARTGTVALRLTDWSWLPAPDGGTRVLLRPGSGSARLLVALLATDRERARLRVLGTVPAVDVDRCQAVGGYLACRTAHAQLDVWRLS